VALLLVFAMPLAELVRFALEDNLFSYILLVPVISGWLIWQKKDELQFDFRPAPGVAMTFLLLALLTAGIALVPGDEGSHATANRLSLKILGFLFAWIGLSAWTLGGRFLRRLAFPVSFLVFLVPLPPAALSLMETSLQHASAKASGWLFTLTGASFLQSGLVIHLSNITIEVAPECSGIRSTLVLFMTSLIAAHLFLERNWQRALFVALVIPLGIARNAVRIVTIGWLCTEIGPEMIHSAIHRRGGPLFFAVSLIPLFAALFLFRWMNRRPNRPPSTSPLPGSTPLIPSGK